MKNSFKTFLILSALICIARSYEEHICNHHKHQAENPPEFLDVEEDFPVLDEKRVLASTNYSQIRIYANYDYLLSTSNASYTSYVKDLLAPAVISYFQGALKVKYPVSGNLKLATTTICGLDTPTALLNGVAADYAILFNSREENSSVVASSKYCFLASGSKRPLVANTNFNRVMFKVADGDVLVHEKNTYLLLHEMIHTFGFSSTTYKFFLDSNGTTLTGHIKSVTIAGSNHTVVDIPALTTKLRTFHGCSTMPGAIMENNGGSGTDDSHFEKKFYLYEVMSSGSQAGKRISNLSLALLEGSGWYVVNYTYAEPYFYGQGQGCNFINGVCSTTVASFDEFCVGTKRGCSSQGNAGGFCASDSKTDGCNYVVPQNNYHCENPDGSTGARLGSAEVYQRGANSKCFSGTLYTKSSTGVYSYCFKYNCTGSGASTKLQVIIGNSTATCTKEGAISVTGYYGTLNCPDPLTFCSTVGLQYCPRNCMGRGKCVSKKCVCNTGFTGTDCALKK